MLEKYLEPLVNLHRYFKEKYYCLFEGEADNIDEGCIASMEKLFSHVLKGM